MLAPPVEGHSQVPYQAPYQLTIPYPIRTLERLDVKSLRKRVKQVSSSSESHAATIIESVVNISSNEIPRRDFYMMAPSDQTTTFAKSQLTLLLDVIRGTENTDDFVVGMSEWFPQYAQMCFDQDERALPIFSELDEVDTKLKKLKLAKDYMDSTEYDANKSVLNQLRTQLKSQLAEIASEPNPYFSFTTRVEQETDEQIQARYMGMVQEKHNQHTALVYRYLESTMSINIRNLEQALLDLRSIFPATETDSMLDTKEERDQTEFEFAPISTKADVSRLASFLLIREILHPVAPEHSDAEAAKNYHSCIGSPQLLRQGYAPRMVRLMTDIWRLAHTHSPRSFVNWHSSAVTERLHLVDSNWKQITLGTSNTKDRTAAEILFGSYLDLSYPSTAPEITTELELWWAQPQIARHFPVGKVITKMLAERGVEVPEGLASMRTLLKGTPDNRFVMADGNGGREFYLDDKSSTKELSMNARDQLEAVLEQFVGRIITEAYPHANLNHRTTLSGNMPVRIDDDWMHKVVGSPLKIIHRRTNIIKDNEFDATERTLGTEEIKQNARVIAMLNFIKINHKTHFHEIKNQHKQVKTVDPEFSLPKLIAILDLVRGHIYELLDFLYTQDGKQSHSLESALEAVAIEQGRQKYTVLAQKLEQEIDNRDRKYSSGYIYKQQLNKWFGL